MNKAVLFLSVLSACTALGAPMPAEGGEKRDTIPIEKVPDVEPPSRETLDQSIRRAADFLLASQNKDGSWGDHTRTKGLNVICPYPEGPRSFRTACTSLCVIGLLASPLKDEPAVKGAVDRAVQYLLATLPLLKRGDTRTVLGVWGHAYGLSALCRAAENLPENSPQYTELKKVASLQVEALNWMADVKGGWGYYTFKTFSRRPMGEPTSFLTATVLIAFKDAERAFGLKADPQIVKRAVASLEKQRTPAGSYVYSISHMFYPGRPINRHTGSLARTPAGDLALIQYDPAFVSRRQLEDGLERIWSRSGWLSLAVKKPIPQESFAQNAGYFFYYGYYYAARCLDQVPRERLPRHAAHLADDILPMQEKDGSWWDYPLYNYHKFYGTGYALFAVSRVRSALYPTTPPAS